MLGLLFLPRLRVDQIPEDSNLTAFVSLRLLAAVINETARMQSVISGPEESSSTTLSGTN